MRVSTLPTGSGERVVLRLLDKDSARLDLDRARHERRRRCDAIDRADPRAARHRARHRPDRLRQDDDALRGAVAAAARRAQHDDGRGSDRVRARRRRADAGQPAHRARLRARAARDPAPGSRHHHDRRDPRSRDRADRRAGVADRPSRARDAAHQRRGERGDASRRHGRRAVSAGVEPARRARAAAGAHAVPGVPRRARAPTRGRSAAAGRARPAARARRCTRPRAARECNDTGYRGRTGVYELLRRRRRDAPADPRPRAASTRCAHAALAPA